jgi:hypothetical protein
MARLVLPPRLELKRQQGSSRAAPLAKVISLRFPMGKLGLTALWQDGSGRRQPPPSPDTQ